MSREKDKIAGDDSDSTQSSHRGSGLPGYTVGWLKADTDQLTNPAGKDMKQNRLPFLKDQRKELDRWLGANLPETKNDDDDYLRDS